jgi:hypothetical protein
METLERIMLYRTRLKDPLEFLAVPTKYESIVGEIRTTFSSTVAYSTVSLVGRTEVPVLLAVPLASTPKNKIESHTRL